MIFDESKIAGPLLLVGGVQFIIALIVAEAIYQSYSTSTNYISDLGVLGKPSAVIFNPSIILLGAVSIIAAYFVKKHFGLGKIGYFFVVAGAGTLTVGVFPENTFLVQGIPVIHAVAALLAFFIGGIAAVSAYRYTKPPFNIISVVLGAVSLTASALFFVTYNMGSLGLGIGGMERMIAYPTLLWIVGLGGYLLGSANEK
jgi:hypothetical membrane protein